MSVAAAAFPGVAAATHPSPTAFTRPVGSPPLSDREAAAHVRPAPEIRPANADENATQPTAAQLAAFYESQEWQGYCAPLERHVTGNFTGTTDEIIQWAAWKWGIDEDIIRAVAVKESWWRMSTVGDGGLSFGITQIKRTVHLGTYPASAQSTAFNLDYYAGVVRYYFEGCATWLNDVEHGKLYVPGDIWGSVGAWYSGRWYVNTTDYLHGVREHLESRRWEDPWFSEAVSSPKRVATPAQCRGIEATIVGTPGAQVIRGTPGSDVIAGTSGGDIVRAGRGNDLVCGAGAGDRIFGGPGRDRLFGGGGPDRLRGGGGRDRLIGGGGLDRLWGGPSQDYLKQ